MSSSSWWITVRIFSWACKTRLTSSTVPFFMSTFYSLLSSSFCIWRSSCTDTKPSLWSFVVRSSSARPLSSTSVHDQRCTLDTDTLSCRLSPFVADSPYIFRRFEASQSLGPLRFCLIITPVSTGNQNIYFSVWVAVILSFECLLSRIERALDRVSSLMHLPRAEKRPV
jgi:hypothetical protein